MKIGYIYIRNIVFVCLAFLALLLVFIPAFIIQLIRTYKHKTANEFLYGLAVAIDYMFGYLLFGEYKHTVSALVYANNVKWAIATINFIFMNPSHCYKAYIHEYTE